MSADDRMVVKLKHPVKNPAGEDLIEEIRFRRGRLGDLKGLPLRFQDVPWDAIMTMLSRMSGQLIEVIERLHEEDAEEVVPIALGFYMRCLKIGETRSDT